ncbi:hypothetical protein JDO7802_00487 [Jannaschia donghaensis]|uniref:Uncharacterized protein n=2 Tax=Jannaschia donghaensis TaxID=420998 RepID=A0A0M6YFP1_9RHOB|nr:hypothetical protein JDO7802_00487 [Jannaschia donghaensis]
MRRRQMIQISLALNVLILIPVTWGLLADSAGMAQAFGPDQPSRRILLAVYLAIAACSAALLLWPGGRMLVPGLLAVQGIYKVLTVPLLGIGHPVVVTNLGIVVVHGVTLATILR